MQSNAAVISPIKQRTASTYSRSSAQAMTPLLAPALQSFGLMKAFRGRTQAQQIADLTWVAEASDTAEAHERIAHLLDELANQSLYL